MMRTGGFPGWAWATMGAASAAQAQPTTVSLFLPDTDPQSLVASVIGVVSVHSMIVEQRRGIPG